MQNIKNHKKIKNLQAENKDLHQQINKVKLANIQEKRNIAATSKVKAEEFFKVKIKNYMKTFEKEIKYLKSQFTQLRFEAIKKEHTLVKFLQIAYDQEMYFNEIRRIVLSKQFRKAGRMLSNVSPNQVGALFNFSAEEQYKISRKLSKAEKDLVGGQNTSVIHDISKISKRIVHQMGRKTEIFLDSNLDSQFISKQLKQKNKDALKDEIDKKDETKKELEYIKRGSLFVLNLHRI